MFVFRKEYLIGVLLAVVLWIGVSLDIVGMHQRDMSLAVMAPISRGSADKSCVSLMFNVDWGEEYIPSLLDILEEHGAAATFFPTGIWAKENSDLLKQIIARGHEVGNHGASHVHVERLPKEEFQAVIKDGEQMILEAAGVAPSKLFAPPYGEWSNSTVEYALEIGYQTILWTVDTVDWRRPAPETIWKRALAGAQPGALILMHPTEPTVEALPEIIAGLKEKGLTPVTVSELMH
jgi:peptidoglycan/xylan/chitin deacetylase (PgdA/CDA1 family)